MYGLSNATGREGVPRGEVRDELQGHRIVDGNAEDESEEAAGEPHDREDNVDLPLGGV